MSGKKRTLVKFLYRCIFCVGLCILIGLQVPSAEPINKPVCFPEKCARINEILILPVNFDCYHLTSGGIREYNHAMSTRSQAIIMEQVGRMLLDKGFSVTTLPEGSSYRKNWRFLRHFYSVANYEILKNVYGRLPFPKALATFDFSLPAIPDSLVYRTTDAVLFIDGFDDRATDKRERKATTAAVISAVSIVTVVLGGPVVVVTVPADQTGATCALVNRKGEIIWYFQQKKTGKIDMTRTRDVKDFFSTLISDLKKISTSR